MVSGIFVSRSLNLMDGLVQSDDLVRLSDDMVQRFVINSLNLMINSLGSLMWLNNLMMRFDDC